MPEIKHIFTSDLDSTFLSFDEWAEGKLSAEEFEAFNALKSKSEEDFQLEYADFYTEWLKDQKITHTIITDGVELVNSHTDEFE